MRDCHNFTGPCAAFAQLGKKIPYRIVPKWVPLLSTSLTVSFAFHLLTPCTKLLHTDEVGHMCFAVSENRLNCEYSTLSALAGKHIQRPLTTQMTKLSVLLTRRTIPFATFTLGNSLEHSTCLVSSLMLAKWYLIQGRLLYVRETHLAPKMSITFGSLDSDVGKGARRPSLTNTTFLVTAVWVFTCPGFIIRFTHKPLRHPARYIHDHVIVSFDIIIE